MGLSPASSGWVVMLPSALPGPSPASVMGHRKDGAEEYAIRLLMLIVAIDRRDRDALPGSAVHHVKQALRILRKRRRV